MNRWIAMRGAVPLGTIRAPEGIDAATLAFVMYGPLVRIMSADAPQAEPWAAFARDYAADCAEDEAERAMRGG